MPWDPDQYHRFQRERFAPFDDLVQLVPRRTGMRVIDLGAGTGELTRKLADMLPESDVLGIDTSREMLERASAQERPGLRFEQRDLRDIATGWDLVFSHAVIHWVPDHHDLIPFLFSLLLPGGRLAVQLPSNHGHPSHLLLAETAEEEPFRQALHGWVRESPVLGLEEYAEMLAALGGHDLTVLEKVYPHILPDADAIAEWMAGTTMVPYRERLPDHLLGPFMDRFRQKLRARYPQAPVFYGFRRILFAATA